MPDKPREPLHPHLHLLREDRTAERKKKPYSGERPNRGGRGVFAPQLESASARIIEERKSKPTLPAGIQPHLVFRVPLAKGANIDQLMDSLRNQAGIEVVSVESDSAIIAFRDTLDLREFQNAINTYKEGPRKGINPRTNKPYKTTKADFLEYIEPDKMRLLNKEDRIGDRLKEIISEDASNIDHSKLYIVDLELWHPGGSEGAKRALDEIKLFIEENQVNGEKVLDTFSGQFIILTKVKVIGTKLYNLLELDIVAEADLPPKPIFDRIQADRATARDFPSPPRPPEDGPRLCIVDSGITSNHPLLANNVGHEEAVLTQASSPADSHGHGTMVAGLAVFGDVRSSYESGQFASQITLYSARVLNDLNEFDDEKLIINQMREAIETFRQPPYDCRVFNLSLGTNIPAFNPERSRQTLWAEELDVLARELKVVLVVSAGNHDVFDGMNASDAETALISYPELLFNTLTGLCDPATAAIALTVGSLAQHNTPCAALGSNVNNIVKPLAGVDEPSPFTRIGPGINGAIKPELIHYGGNLCFTGFGNTFRQINDEPGTAVMSFSHQPTQQLFSYKCGTSFSAPRIARLAALIEHGLTKDLGELPSSNLVRAVLASTADIPKASIDLFNSHNNINATRKVCGYGFPSESDALKSHNRRVTMVYQGNISIDHFNVFAVPIPDEFRYANGERKIIVTLAYDPPVRRRRLDYLGVEMDVILIRGKSLDEVFNAFRKVGPDEDPAPAISSAGIDLEPKATPRNAGYSRKKSTLQRCEKIWRQKERPNTNYGNEYYLVIRSVRKWAPGEIETQDFGLAVTICADDPQLYNNIALRVKQREQARARTR
ncbi:MAG: S8 family peptidase [Colwellia sp.]|nr:S8 family peptidase [Colwellia sp.]